MYVLANGLFYSYNLAKVFEYAHPSKVVQTTESSDDSFLGYMGHGEDEGNSTQADYHMSFRYGCHPVEVNDKESTDDSVEAQHDNE